MGASKFQSLGPIRFPVSVYEGGVITGQAVVTRQLMDASGTVRLYDEAGNEYRRRDVGLGVEPVDEGGER